MKTIIHWLPRILSIIFIIFISMFALDVIGQPGWILGLLAHLTPSCFLIAITIVAWKNEKLGGLLFLLTGVGFSIFTHFQAWIIFIPALTIGILFLTIKLLAKK